MGEFNKKKSMIIDEAAEMVGRGGQGGGGGGKEAEKARQKHRNVAKVCDNLEAEGNEALGYLATALVASTTVDYLESCGTWYRAKREEPPGHWPSTPHCSRMFDGHFFEGVFVLFHRSIPSACCCETQADSSKFVERDELAESEGVLEAMLKNMVLCEAAVTLAGKASSRLISSLPLPTLLALHSLRPTTYHDGRGGPPWRCTHRFGYQGCRRLNYSWSASRGVQVIGFCVSGVSAGKV